MMNPASIANLKCNRAPKAAPTKLKAWRTGQIITDPETRTTRAMRITDTERLYGIKAGTWHAWEQPVGHPAFRRPDDANMRRLCVEITKGELTPADFYQLQPET